MKIKNATKKGYLEAEVGDGIDISGRMEHHRGTVQKGKSQSITTSGGGNIGVMVKKVGNYHKSNHNASSIIDPDGIAPTVMENHGTVTAIVDKKKPLCLNSKGGRGEINGLQPSLQDRVYSSSSSSSAITTSFHPSIETMDLTIRKLTPRECLRLMGLYDSEIDKIIDKFSDAILYHLAGDSIVVQVLENIIKELL